MQRRAQVGFTLVELLVVIVVIAILAAITIVSYNGITGRANDAAEKSTVSQFQQLLEMYNTYNAQYPKLCAQNDGTGCTIANPSSYTAGGALLVPAYTASLPSFPEPTQYVRDVGGLGYGLLMNYNSGTCKIVVNGVASWWGSGTPLC